MDHHEKLIIINREFLNISPSLTELSGNLGSVSLYYISLSGHQTKTEMIACAGSVNSVVFVLPEKTLNDFQTWLSWIRLFSKSLRSLWSVCDASSQSCRGQHWTSHPSLKSCSLPLIHASAWIPNKQFKVLFTVRKLGKTWVNRWVTHIYGCFSVKIAF